MPQVFYMSWLLISLFIFIFFSFLLTLTYFNYNKTEKVMLKKENFVFNWW